MCFVRRSSGALVVLLLAVVASAQARHPFVGRVRSAGDRTPGPVEIVCVSVPPGDSAAPADVVRAMADAAGHFRVDLLVGRIYSGWAQATTAGGDGVPVSPVRENLPAVVPTDFELELVAFARQVRVAHAAEWAAHGVTRLRVAPLARQPHGVVVPIARDGTSDLPPLAGREQLAEVLDAAGEVVFRCRLAADAREVTLPPPQSVPVQVVDDAGAAVAGAVVAHEVPPLPAVSGALVPMPTWPSLRPAATTDAGGKATLVVARARSLFAAPDQMRLVCTARCDGYAEAVSGWDGERFEDGRAGQRDPERLRFVLHRTPPLVVRVSDGAGRPRAGVPVWLRGRCSVQLTDLIGTHERVWCVPTGADGVARLAVVDGMTALELVVAGVPGLHPDALRSDGPLVVDGREAAVVPLRVIGLDGAPVAHGLVRIAPVGGEWLAPHGSTLCLDAAGRATLRLPPGAWSLAVTDGRGFAVTTCDVSRATGAIALQLERLATARLVAVDGRGAPAAKARIGIVQYGRGDQAVAAADETLDRAATWLAFAFVDGCRTDRNGEAELRFLPRDGKFVVRAQVELGGGAATFALGEVDGVLRVVLDGPR